MDRIQYNAETRSFSFISKGFKQAAKWGNSATGKGIKNLAGTAIAVAGVATAIKRANKTFRPDYVVVFQTANGPQKSTTKAKDAIEASKLIKARNPLGRKFKAFLTPDHNERAQEYYQNLQSS